MLRVLRARIQQKRRTLSYPRGPIPEMPDRFAGRPVIEGACPGSCTACVAACPVQAIAADAGNILLDMGRCLFCRACEKACDAGRLRFTVNHQLAAIRRGDLMVGPGAPLRAEVLSQRVRDRYGRSFKLRQVSAGGCNACEADVNVLETPAWDMGRFGIQFVASPRHADGLLITGPVTENMALALKKTYDAVPEPRVVIAVGACAIAGGPFVGHPEVHDGVMGRVPIDLFVPGCPPHPLTTLDALLRFLGKPVPGFDPA